MLEIFRRNLLINSILLLPYILILRINTLLHPKIYVLDGADNAVMNLIFSNIPSALVQNIIANVLIFLQALLINQLCIKHRVSKEITLFPGLIYIVLVSLVGTNNMLSPILIANTFIILAMMNLLSTYKLPNATAFVFNTGFYIGMASLIYIPYFVFSLFGVISLLLLRSFKIQEKLQFFLGFIVPYVFLYTYKYWFDIKFGELDFLKEIFFRIPNLKFDDYIVFYVSVLSILAFVVIAIFNYGLFTAKKSIQTQKKIDIFYWLLLFSLISFFIFRTSGTFHLVSLAFPLCVLIGMLLNDSKLRMFYEIIHIMFLALIFIIQFDLLKI